MNKETENKNGAAATTTATPDDEHTKDSAFRELSKDDTRYILYHMDPKEWDGMSTDQRKALLETLHPADKRAMASFNLRPDDLAVMPLQTARGVLRASIINVANGIVNKTVYPDLPPEVKADSKELEIVLGREVAKLLHDPEYSARLDLLVKYHQGYRELEPFLKKAVKSKDFQGRTLDDIVTDSVQNHNDVLGPGMDMDDPTTELGRLFAAARKRYKRDHPQKKYKTRAKKSAAAVVPIPEKLDFLPTSSAMSALFKIMANNGRPYQYADEQKKISHHIKAEVIPDGQHLTYSIESQKGKRAPIYRNVVRVPMIARMTGNTQRYFVLIMSLIRKQAWSAQRGLYQDHVSFTIKSTVDSGMFPERHKAARALEEAATDLSTTAIKIETGKKNDKDFDIGVLFNLIRKEGRNVVVYLNPKMNWAGLMQQFAPLPPYWQLLSDNALRLLLCAMEQSRFETGKVELSLNAVRFYMGVMPPDESKNKPRDIQQPIMKAVKEVMSQEKKLPASERMYNLSIAADESGRVEDWLTAGHLVIEPVKNAAAYLDIKKDAREQNRIKLEQKRAKLNTTKQGA